MLIPGCLIQCLANLQNAFLITHKLQAWDWTDWTWYRNLGRARLTLLVQSKACHKYKVAWCSSSSSSNNNNNNNNNNNLDSYIALPYKVSARLTDMITVQSVRETELSWADYGKQQQSPRSLCTWTDGSTTCGQLLRRPWTNRLTLTKVQQVAEHHWNETLWSGDEAEAAV